MEVEHCPQKTNREIENLGSGPMFHFHDHREEGVSDKHFLDALLFLEIFGKELDSVLRVSLPETNKQRVCKPRPKNIGYIYICTFICKGLPVHRGFCCENFREWRLTLFSLLLDRFPF